MKVIAVKNVLLHPCVFHRIRLSLDPSLRRLTVKCLLATTSDPQERPVFGEDEIEAHVDLALLRNRPDWCDHQSYFLALKDGRIGPLFSLFGSTLPTRQSATEFATLTQQSLLVGINVPFADATDDELFVTVNMNQRSDDQDVAVEGGLSLVLSDASSSGTIRTLMLPHLRVTGPETLGAGAEATLTVRVEDVNGEPINRTATVYLEAVTGVLPKSRVVAEGGVATFPVYATGLAPGEKVRVKVGWKYFSGVDDITIAVV